MRFCLPVSHVGFVMVLVALTCFTGFAQEAIAESPSKSGEILVEEADLSLSVKLVPSAEIARKAEEVRPRLRFDYAGSSCALEIHASPQLASITTNVEPRIVVDYGATSFTGSLAGSSELSRLAKEVAPRIVISHAAASVLRQDLQGSADLQITAQDTHPRIRITHAERGTIEPVSPPSILSPTLPPPSFPTPSPMLWIVIGIALGVLIAVVIWRLGG